MASYHFVCDVVTPLSTGPLVELLPTVFKHNTVLMMGAAVMSFHYNSGSFVRYHLRLALAKLFHFDVHLRSQAVYLHSAILCAECSIPFGIDDPTHSSELAETLLSISNSTKRATTGRGSNSSPIIAANLSLQDKVTRSGTLCKHSCMLCSMVSSIGK